VSRKRLDSWKAIAVFLDRSLRTVQRWHTCNGLPVHHFGGQKGSVFAYEEEIEQWLADLAEESGATQQRADAMLEAGKRRSQELTQTANNMWESRSEQNIQAIAELHRGAIAEDSSNSAAYAGLANAMVFCALTDIIDGSMAYPSAAEALRRVAPLDCRNLDTQCTAAWIDLLYNRNWSRAHMGFDGALSKHPTSFALAGLAAMDIAEGDILRAQSRAWEAWRFNPLVSSLGAFLCWVVYLNGHFQQALDLVTQIRSGGGDGGFLTAIEALALMQSGPAEVNLGRLEKAVSGFPSNCTLLGVLGYAYGSAGRKSDARSVYEHLAQGSEVNRRCKGYGHAIASMGLGNSQEAIDGLETAYVEGTIWSLGFRHDPILRCFVGDPRFERLIGKIGTPAHYHAEKGFLGLRERSSMGPVLVGDRP
jgi:hypothetical protein